MYRFGETNKQIARTKSLTSFTHTHIKTQSYFSPQYCEFNRNTAVYIYEMLYLRIFVSLYRYPQISVNNYIGLQFEKSELKKEQF